MGAASLTSPFKMASFVCTAAVLHLLQTLPMHSRCKCAYCAAEEHSHNCKQVCMRCRFNVCTALVSGLSSELRMKLACIRSGSFTCRRLHAACTMEGNEGISCMRSILLHYFWWRIVCAVYCRLQSSSCEVPHSMLHCGRAVSYTESAFYELVNSCQARRDCSSALLFCIRIFPRY